MTDPFTDDGNPVTQQGESAPFVIRLSRTASGSRTYTIGATLGRDEVPEHVVAALFELERLVNEGMVEPVRQSKPRAERDNTLRDLRRSVLIEALRKMPIPEAFREGWDGWYTTSQIVTALGNGNHRSQVVADLKSLVADGLVEYQRGKGGNYPSRYRLAPTPEQEKRRLPAERKTRAQKGGGK